MIELMEYIDGATLIIVNILLSSISAIVMLTMYLGMRSAKGLFVWMLGNAAFATGFSLLMSDETLPVMSSLLANLIIDMGAILSYVAVLQFLERPRRDLWLIAPAVLLAVVEVVMFFQRGVDYRMTTVLGCSLRALVTIGAGWQLLRFANPQMRPASTLSAVFHFIWAAMLLSRIAWWAFSHYSDTGEDPTTPYALIMRIALTFVVTPSYLWMVTRRLDSELLKQARQDPLTGIANRRIMWESGEKTLNDALRVGRKLGLLMIDVDHFKSVNDRFGHGTGDRVLVAVAQTLSNNLREGDMVARVGGEEFMVLLMPEVDHALTLAIGDRLRVAVESLEFPLPDGQVLRCTISVGYSLFNRDGYSWEDIVAAADRGLYSAKHLGRNRIEAPPLAAA